MFSTLPQLAAMLTAATVLGGSAWATLDYLEIRPVIEREMVQLEQQLETVSESVLLNRFQFLTVKLKMAPLSFEEQIEYCRIAEALKYNLALVQGCR